MLSLGSFWKFYKQNILSSKIWNPISNSSMQIVICRNIITLKSYLTFLRPQISVCRTGKVISSSAGMVFRQNLLQFHQTKIIWPICFFLIHYHHKNVASTKDCSLKSCWSQVFSQNHLTFNKSWREPWRSALLATANSQGLFYHTCLLLYFF